MKKTTKKKQSISKAKNQTKLLLLFAILFALVGVYYLTRSMAEADTQAPSAVSDVSAKVTQEGVTISYLAANDNVKIAKYHVQFTTVGDDYHNNKSFYTDTQALSASFPMNSNLWPDTTFHGLVYAVDAAGNIGPSTPVTYRTEKDMTKPYFAQPYSNLGPLGTSDTSTLRAAPYISATTSKVSGGSQIYVWVGALGDNVWANYADITVTDPTGKSTKYPAPASYGGQGASWWAPKNAVVASISTPTIKNNVHGIFKISAQVRDHAGNISDQILTTSVTL